MNRRGQGGSLKEGGSGGLQRWRAAGVEWAALKSPPSRSDGHLLALPFWPFSTSFFPSILASLASSLLPPYSTALFRLPSILPLLSVLLFHFISASYNFSLIFSPLSPSILAFYPLLPSLMLSFVCPLFYL